MNRKRDSRVALAGILSLAVVTVATAEPSLNNWPQWRGPTRDARVAGGPAWPDSLQKLAVQWRVPLGPSYSGPIVWGERVFVTATQNEEREVVIALDRHTGSELWKTSWPGALSVPFFAKSNGDWIRSTPACDGESLYVGGMRDVLVCLEVATGAERWRLDFPKRLGTPVPAFGCVSSPIVVGEFVFVQAGGAFRKINKRTGKPAWKILEDGGGMDSAFSSPVLATVGGADQLVVQTRQHMVGVDPGEGRILWRQQVPSFRGMNILTPTVFGDGIFTSTHKNRSFFYRVTADGGTFAVREAWTAKARGYMSSPVEIGGYAYLHLGNGRLCCIDLRDGKETWRSEPFGKYWSMVARGNRILALDERGEILLIDANPREFVLLDRKKVSDSETWGHLAISGRQIFVRALNGVAAFDWQP